MKNETFPLPSLRQVPADIRERILQVQVQEKAGFIPNVFLLLAPRPFRQGARPASAVVDLQLAIGFHRPQ